MKQKIQKNRDIIILREKKKIGKRTKNIGEQWEIANNQQAK